MVSLTIAMSFFLGTIGGIVLGSLATLLELKRIIIFVVSAVGSLPFLIPAIDEIKKMRVQKP